MVFTAEQKAFMVEAYFRTSSKVDDVYQGDLQACLQEFQEQYPLLAILPDNFAQTVTRMVELFRTTGSIKRKEGSGRKKVRTEEVIEEVREIVNEDPRKSLRKISQEVGLSRGTVNTIMKKDLDLYPYHIQSVHEIQPPDFEKRRLYCNWFLANLNNNEVLNKSFFTDEAHFYLSGYINSQLMRYWSAEKPDFHVEAPLHPQKIGVWIAMSRNRLIGPIFFEGRTAGRIFSARQCYTSYSTSNFGFY